MFNMNQIGKKIMCLRKEHNITQMELADKLGISFQAISNWERGNTMPDISKLPELAEIFNISIDELLNDKAPLVGAVLNDTVDTYIEEGKATEQEIADTLPLLKPEQVEKILDKADISKFHDISSFLPFMNSNTLAEIAVEYIKRGDSVSKLLPFLDEEDVTSIAFDALEQGGAIDIFLPFMPEEDVAILAKKLDELGHSNTQCYPFMDEDDVNELAIKAFERGDSIDKYLPFMEEDDVTQLALKVLLSKKK